MSNVGHRHPEVLEAIHQQLEKYMHLMVYGEYVQSPQVLLAQRLSTLIPGLDSVYFVNSGAEAIEGSIKLARRVTGRKKIIAFKNAYHGSTTGALSLKSDPYFKEPFQPLLPEVIHLNPDDFRSLEFIDETTAAVFTEVIRGEAGAIPVSTEFLQALRARCTETGAMMVLDEIQTGFGRTGTFFACQQHGITPDILVMAKGMGGGMPIGAFMSSYSYMQQLTDQPVLGHITTFGGHPVSCAASIATFDIIQRLNIQETVPALEAIVRKELQHPSIVQISGKGLLLAIEFADQAFDHVVLSRTLQTVRHTEGILLEMLRVGKEAVVSFPNFAYWKNLRSVLDGRMPVSEDLPYQWYDSPNVRFFTLLDFEALCDQMGLIIRERHVLDESGNIVQAKDNREINFLGSLAVYRLTQKH